MENNIKTALLERIKDRTAVVSVLGLGYVGLPLAVVGRFGGGEVTLGADSAPLRELSALYRGAFAAAVG